jgi:hypothetical protein
VGSVEIVAGAYAESVGPSVRKEARGAETDARVTLDEGNIRGLLERARATFERQAPNVEQETRLGRVLNR